MFAETAELTAELNLKGNFAGQMKGAQGALQKFDTKLAKTSGRAFKAGEQIGRGIRNGMKIAAVGVAILATQVLAGLGNLAKLESAQAQTNAVLTSTKKAAGISAQAVRNLAEKYEGLNATIDDKVIQSGENVLLTFTNIRKKAFEPALLAALNLNEAMGGGEGGLQKTIIQVGKALNDPAKGFTALRRVGVSFSAEQEKRIKKLQKEGKLYEAQQVILRELNKEFGGSFAAGGKTAAGAVAGIGDAVEDLQTALASSLFPTIQKLLPKVRAFLTSKEFVKGAEDLGKAVGEIFSEGNIAEGGRILKSAFKAAQEAAPVLAGAARQIGAVVSKSVELFRSLPPELQALLVGGVALNKITGGLVTNIAGGLTKGAIDLFAGRGSSPANAMWVRSAGGGVGGGVTGGKGGLSGLSKVFLAGEAIGLALLVKGVADEISAGNTRLSEDIRDTNAALISSKPTPEALKQAMAGVDQGIRDLTSNPFHVLVQGDALDNLRAMRDSLRAAAQRQGVGTTLQSPDRQDDGGHTPVAADQSRPLGGIGLTIKAPDLTQEVRRLQGLVRQGGPRADKANIKLARIATFTEQTRSATNRVKGALDRKKLSVRVGVTSRNNTFLNGRLVQANLSRYETKSGSFSTNFGPI